MTKTEFLTELARELAKRNVADAADVMEEYAQHFAFKLADGYSEEEIAAKLGTPAVLAAQFEAAEAPQRPGAGSRVLTKIGLGLTELFGGLLFLLLAAWELVMAAAAIACGGCAVCLLAKLGLFGLIPAMPYGCAVLLALTLLALGVLFAAGCVWYAAFLRQLVRAFGRFRHNTLARSKGCAVLPPLPAAPQLSGKSRRTLRRVALGAAVCFAACFVLTVIVSMIAAGALQFWHVWGWFGYQG